MRLSNFILDRYVESGMSIDEFSRRLGLETETVRDLISRNILADKQTMHKLAKGLLVKEDILWDALDEQLQSPTKKPYTEMGNYLRELRNSLGYSVADVAAITGYSYKQVQKLEGGWHLPSQTRISTLISCYKADRKKFVSVYTKLAPKCKMSRNAFSKIISIIWLVNNHRISYWCAAMNCSHSTFIDWKNTSTLPSHDHLLEIASAFGISVFDVERLCADKDSTYEEVFEYVENSLHILK